MTGQRLCLLPLFLSLTCSHALAQGADLPPAYNRSATPGDPPPVPGYEKGSPAAAVSEPEVLGRGPIHEGYAQPGDPSPRPTPIVPKAPPAPIREVPPEERPDGDDVVWLPGYWMWDDERGDYLWVSGFWRVVPPGRKWMPGYWAKVEGGHRWVSGFWADAAQPAVPYFDAPPASLEIGPNQPAPDAGYQWVTGIWLARNDNWLWRPGFWVAPRSGWVYTPARYFWSPRGYLYSGGFWDRCLLTRGVPFAPAFISPGLCSSPGFSFTPRFALNLGATLGSFWARPGWGYYAYGDYYGAGYARRGYQPWHSYGPRARDPLYTYYSGAFAGRNPGWAAGLASTYDRRVRGTLPVPPRTYAAQTRITDAAARTVTPLTGYRNPTLPLVRASAVDRAASERIVSAYGRATAERSQVELRPSVGAPGALSLATVPAPSARPRSESIPSIPSIDKRPRELSRPAEYSASLSPRITTTPRAITVAPAPRVMTAPRATSPIAPRSVPTVRYTAPTVRYSAPTVRYSTPTAPRYSAPAARSVPRYSAPISSPARRR